MELPAIGYGTMGASGEAMATALRCGYRLFDTAEAYDNLAAVSSAIKDSGVPREELCIVTKVKGLPCGEYDAVKTRVQNHIQALGLEYVDVLLLHWPGEEGNPDSPEAFNYSTVEYFTSNINTAWGHLQRLKAEGATRQIGVSNFYGQHLDAWPAAGELPYVNEIFVNSETQETELVDRMRNLGIRILAYRPLAYRPYPEAVTKAAEARGESSTTTLIRWFKGRGIVPLIRSENEGHLTENLAATQKEGEGVEAGAFTVCDGGGCGDWFARGWRLHGVEVEVDESGVEMLVAMGIPEEAARKALKESKNDLEMASMLALGGD